MIAVDLFAGLGGFSEGARLAGVEVAWAANHWRAAVDVHESNHPGTVHHYQDLHQADWSRVPAHDVLLASPSCTGHTRARGKERPGHDAARSTAWAVVSCVQYHRPEFVVVENVPELRRWVLYPAWRSAMSALGYALEEGDRRRRSRGRAEPRPPVRHRPSRVRSGAANTRGDRAGQRAQHR